METVTNLLFLGSKITVDCDRCHEIKRCLLLGRKAKINLESVLKSRDITLPTQVRIVKAMAFPVAVCGCESWTAKKTEHQRIDGFELWWWRSLLRCPWTTRIQPILKGINPEYSLEGLMLKMKLQYFGYYVKSQLIEKDPDAGKVWRQERRGWQRMRCLDGITNSVDMNLSKLWVVVKDRDA